MRVVRVFTNCVLAIMMGFLLLTPAWSADNRYMVSLGKFGEAKRFYDDPRPYYKELNYKKVLPAEIYSGLICNREEAGKLWASLVGFRAPDVVGKIAPEIKPGKYVYKDKEKYPGLKALMIPGMYEAFKPGAAPFIGNFPEIDVVATSQFYYHTRIGQATKENSGHAKLNSEGYLVPKSYVSGLPFPAPTGQFKAQQYLYNWEKNYVNSENYIALARQRGYTKNLKMDYDAENHSLYTRLEGRCMFRPYGFYDARAKDKGEHASTVAVFFAPRDKHGDGSAILYYTDPARWDLFHAYAGSIRRIRKMSATDTQDSVGGADVIFDDRGGFAQKLSPGRFPYKYEVVEEREYLVPYSAAGSEYFKSGNLELHNLKFQRRPVAVIKLTQLDPNYVYGKRLMYFDRETLNLLYIENYDQKGRLYRSLTSIYNFDADTGTLNYSTTIMKDHIDLHNTVYLNYVMPAGWVGRERTSSAALLKTGK